MEKNRIVKIIIICIVLISLMVTIITFMSNNNEESTITYDEIVSKMKNKDKFLIYYYNSRNTNKYDKSIKKHLDDNGIKYYSYNDVYIDEEEYNKLLELLDIDKDLFGLPALIYIEDGIMFGNIINIDSNKVVDTFIKDYNLYSLE